MPMPVYAGGMEPFVETFVPLVVAVLTPEQYRRVRKESDAAPLLDWLRREFGREIFWLCHYDIGFYPCASELFWHVGRHEPLEPQLQAMRGRIEECVQRWFAA